MPSTADGSDRRRLAAFARDRQKGQNVRLAAKLLGWKNRLKSEEEKRSGSGDADGRHGGAGRAGLRADRLWGWKRRGRKCSSRYRHHREAGRHTPEQLEEIQGVRSEGVEKIFECVNAYYAQFEQPADAASEAQLAGGGSRRCAKRGGADRRSRSGLTPGEAEPAVEAESGCARRSGADREAEAARPGEAEPAGEAEAAVPGEPERLTPRRMPPALEAAIGTV